MTKPLVLLTGANGHIGFRVLVFLLRAGHNVRACVRHSSREKLIREAPSIQSLNLASGQLSFVSVPDLCADGAYDEVIKGAELIVHIAGPIAKMTDMARLDEELVLPSVKGTMNILYAANKSPAVKRVVLASSIVAIMTWSTWSLVEDPQVTNEKSRVSDTGGPYEVDWQAYHAGKVNSFNATEKWVKETKPHFDVINIHPSIVVGPHELVSTTEELLTTTNALMLLPVMGINAPVAVAGVSVHLDDCAEVFLRALDTAKVHTSDGLLSLIPHSCSPNGVVWDDVLEVVRKTWPELVKTGILPCTGSTPSKKTLIDASETERLLGMKFRGMEEQAKYLMSQYINMVTGKQKEIETTQVPACP